MPHQEVNWESAFITVVGEHGIRAQRYLYACTREVVHALGTTPDAFSSPIPVAVAPAMNLTRASLARRCLPLESGASRVGAGRSSAWSSSSLLSSSEEATTG